MFQYGDSIPLPNGNSISPGDTVTVQYDNGQSEVYSYDAVLAWMNNPRDNGPYPWSNAQRPENTTWPGVNAYFEEAGVFDRALTATEMQMLANNQLEASMARPARHAFDSSCAMDMPVYPPNLYSTAICGTGGIDLGEFSIRMEEAREDMYHRWETDVQERVEDMTYCLRTRIMHQHRCVGVYRTIYTRQELERYPDHNMFLRHVMERHFHTIVQRENREGRIRGWSNIQLPTFPPTIKIPKRKTHAERMQMEISYQWQLYVIAEAEKCAQELLGTLIGKKQLEIYQDTDILYVDGDRYDWSITKDGDVRRVDHRNKVYQRYCVSLMQRGDYPPTDNVIALKAAIEANEREFMQIANAMGQHHFEELPPGACRPNPKSYQSHSLKDQISTPRPLSQVLTDRLSYLISSPLFRAPFGS